MLANKPSVPSEETFVPVNPKEETVLSVPLKLTAPPETIFKAPLMFTPSIEVCPPSACACMAKDVSIVTPVAVTFPPEEANRAPPED